MIICPCCGFKFEGNLRHGCKSCGARSVGDPLPKPERELPAYGRPLLLVATGILMSLGFLAETIIALAERSPLSFGLWSWVAAGETAAWRLKWIAVPVMFVVLWSGRRIYQSMMLTPERFVGLAIARRGLLVSALVSLTFVTLIGVTVPARLRQRQMSIDAAQLARAHTFDRAVLEYQALYKTNPSEQNDLRSLPDPDGSIAAALENLDPSWYHPSSTVAELPTKPRRVRSGAALITVSASTTDEAPGALSFTSYELRLPGADKIYGTDDDLIVRDGVTMTVNEARERGTVKPAAATAIRSRKP